MLDFYFFLGRKKVRKWTFSDQNRCFRVPTGPPERVFARHPRTKLSRAVFRTVESRWTPLSFWTFLKSPKNQQKTQSKTLFFQKLVKSLFLKISLQTSPFSSPTGSELLEKCLISTFTFTFFKVKPMMNRGIWAVFHFYFYFFRRKTNIELRYVS